MSNYYNVETNKGNVTVYVPDGNPEKVESGVPVAFIANAPLFIELLNKNYGIMLLHYQDSSKVDIQRLINRTVNEYLKEISK